MKEGQFRQDLYYRINTIMLEVPPLRSRNEDILPLARSVLRRLAVDMGRAEAGLDASAERALVRYPWPGNVRELRNVLERALLLGNGSSLTATDLRFDSTDPAPTSAAIDGALTLKELEVRYIEQVLGELDGRVPAAADRLGVPKSSLYQKLKTYGIDASKFRNLEADV